MTKKYLLEDFSFSLPEELIAQYPTNKRDDSRLFILERKNKSFSHDHFYNLINYLHEDDLLIFNNAKVIHARIFCVRESGGRIEIILTQRLQGNQWLIISNRTKRLKQEEILYCEENYHIHFTVIERQGDFLKVESNEELTEDKLAIIGEIPLPPYMNRSSEEKDSERYQTVYAKEPGAVAAPTAGLHFTEELINHIQKIGIEIAYVTLFVSWATFQPVRQNNLSHHQMHTERYILDEQTTESINNARLHNRRIIAVGTTTLRVLESTFKKEKNVAGYGETDIFIYPPFEVKSIDGMITNFHTPHSTLLMLVAAVAGYDTIMKAYREAVERKYRFFSYGDAMLII